MKAETIIKKIISENQCSIATAELLDRALKREKHLPNNVWLRFRPITTGTCMTGVMPRLGGSFP